MANQMWIDEIQFHDAYFQREPSAYQQMLQIWAGSPTNNRHWESREERMRRELKARRTREQQNCLHGRRLFPINYAPGIHPFGPREFWANIEGLAGGPFLLSESDHQILHEFGRKHEHVKTAPVRDFRVRKTTALFTP